MPVNRGEYFPIEIQGLEVVTGMHILFLQASRILS